MQREAVLTDHCAPRPRLLRQRQQRFGFACSNAIAAKRTLTALPVTFGKATIGAHQKLFGARRDAVVAAGAAVQK